MEKYLSTLTSKGQTTIPVQVRTHLNLDVGHEIEFELIDDSTGKAAIVRNVGLFKNLREIFAEVLRKAKEYSTISEPDDEEIVNLSDIAVNDKWLEYSIQFQNYLNSLDYEIVKIIRVIMYLGRDEDYDKNDPVGEIYRKQRAFFDDNIGWNTQEIEVNQILGKSLRLYGYLLNGFKILKIDL